MVLDAKALSWAARNNIDTAKLKAARVPIFGKWYFPELPPNVPLVNLESGAQRIFPERMLAGEVIWAPAADLQRAGLLPENFSVLEAPPQTDAHPSSALRTLAPEPLLAIARPPGLERPTTAMVPVTLPLEDSEEAGDVAGIHMPSGSVAPFVLGVGFCIFFLGLITNVFIALTGLLWMAAGAVGWIRIGLLEARAASAHEADVDEAA